MINLANSDDEVSGASAEGQRPLAVGTKRKRKRTAKGKARDDEAEHAQTAAALKLSKAKEYKEGAFLVRRNCPSAIHLISDDWFNCCLRYVPNPR